MNANLFGQEEYFNAFLGMIPEYCCDDHRRLIGPSHEWVPMLLSYSFYFGLGVGLNDSDLAKALRKNITEGVALTCEITLAGFKPLRDMYDTKNDPGALWRHVTSYLTTLMAIMSPETLANDVNEELVRGRAPWVGFIPGLVLASKDLPYAKMLYTDAIKEQQSCDEEELIERINFMKHMIGRALS